MYQPSSRQQQQPATTSNSPRRAPSSPFQLLDFWTPESCHSTAGNPGKRSIPRQHEHGTGIGQPVIVSWVSRDLPEFLVFFFSFPSLPTRSLAFAPLLSRLSMLLSLYLPLYLPLYST